MLGLDKKAVGMIGALRETTGVKDGELSILNDMWNRYHEHDTHFFTKAQRELIKSIYRRYFSTDGKRLESGMAWSAADKKMREELRNCVEKKAVSKSDIEWAQTMLDWCLSTDSDHITGGRRESIQRILKAAKLVPIQTRLYNQLKEKFESGGISTGSPPFSEKMLLNFERFGSWTPTQQEHVEKIINDNLDPGETKLPGAPEEDENAP